MTLYWADDCALLGIDANYHAWGNQALLMTANGLVWRREVVLEVNMKDGNGALIGPWK